MKGLKAAGRLGLILWLACVCTLAEEPFFWRHSVVTNSSFAREFSTRVWTTAEGLPLNYVQALEQTRDGFLWAGTRSGLARFDGERFTVFNTATTAALKSHNILALKEGPDGALWIGTTDGAVCFRNHEFTHFALPHGHPDEGWVNGFAFGASGEVWAATHQGPGTMVNGTFAPDKTFAPYKHRNTAWRECMSIGFDSAGVLFVSTRQGLMRKRSGSWETVYKHAGGQAFNGTNGVLWMVRPVLYSFENGQARHRDALSGEFKSEIRSAAVDGNGRIWAAAENRVYVVGSNFREVECNPRIPGEINVLLADREGNLWAGTSQGLVRCAPGTFRAITAADGLANADVWSIAEGADGAVWAGTSGGVVRISGEKIENWVPLREPKREKAGSVQHVLSTRAGELWCNPDNIIYRFREGEGFTKVSGPDFPEVRGRPVYEDADGSVWIDDGGHLTRWKEGKCIEKFVPGGQVASMLRDTAGRLWVGTKDAGLFCFEPGRTNHIGAGDGLASLHCGAVLAEKDGTVWLASDRGLHRWRAGKIALFTANDGMPDDVVLNVLADDFGWFWLNGHRGIYRVQKAVLEDFSEERIPHISYVAYNEASGLPAAEGNGGTLPNSIKARDGKLWFPTIKGIAVVNPVEAHAPLPPPIPSVTAITVDQELVFGDGKGFSSGIPRLEFPPGRGQVVRIDFAAPTLAPNAAARFRYRLEPQDRDWVSARGEKFAFYTNVKPGTYRFRVQAINPDGNFAEAESVAFVFVPHFYQRPLFFAGAAAALLVIGISIHAGRLRVQRRILRLEQQNALEKERSRIAADIHDALGSELSRIALLSERLRRGEVADESAAAGAISQTARDMGTNLSELIWATNAHNDTLDNLASYLRTHAATQCDSAGLRLDGAVDEIPPCPVSGLVRHNLYLIFREALTNVLKHAQASVVRLDISFRDGLLEITLEDNGCGFPPELASRGNGQANLRRRAAEIGADISISSGPSGNGTRVRLLWQPPARNESRCT